MAVKNGKRLTEAATEVADHARADAFMVDLGELVKKHKIDTVLIGICTGDSWRTQRAGDHRQMTALMIELREAVEHTVRFQRPLNG